MIRYLQKLKHKKGFTLVEMVVVMAIIAALASMLIPSLTQYVTLSRVTAVNASASSIRKNIQAFMLDLSIQNKGMRRSALKGNQKITVSSQVIWLVNNYKWCVKTECKPGYMDAGHGWHDAYADTAVGPGNDRKAVQTCYNDADHWYRSTAFFNVPDNATVNDQDHIVAMSVSVRNMMTDLKTGIVIAVFEAGLCKGVIYIPNWNHKWPGSATPSGFPTTGYTGGDRRPKLFRGRTDSDTYKLPEFCPWHGVWPKDADDRIWRDGVAGIDIEEGWYVGTSPVVTATLGRRAYRLDWEDPMPGT